MANVSVPNDLEQMIDSYANNKWNAKTSKEFIVEKCRTMYRVRVTQAAEHCDEITDQEAIELAKNNIFENNSLVSNEDFWKVIVARNKDILQKQYTAKAVAEAIARTETKNFTDYKQSIKEVTELHTRSTERIMAQAMNQMKEIMEDMTKKLIEHDKSKDKNEE